MKYLAIDLGNVLCHVDFEEILNNISRTLNVSNAETMYFLNRVQKIHDLGLTNLSDEIKDHFKIKSEGIVKDIIQVWNTCISPNKQILDKLVDWSFNHDVKIAILSNIGIEHKDNLNTILAGNHKTVILKKAITHFSCDVGCRKPSLLYYQSFLQQYPEFKGCVYVDDLKENLATSEKFGLKTFHFDLNNYFSPNKFLKPNGFGSLTQKLDELNALIMQ